MSGCEVIGLDTRPIGMFDSGFGGVSVLAEAVKRLPGEDFVYFGDNANAPYGDRAPEEVLRFTRAAGERRAELRCKAIVIAGNTATCVAAETLRRELTLPIVAMEPALKPASLLPVDGSVLVMATTMTLKLQKFHHLMELYGKDAIPVPCPGLAECVEGERVAGPEVERRLRGLLAPYLGKPVKAVVLGCTHYVFLRGALKNVLPEGVRLVDGNAGTVKQLERRLAEGDLLRGDDAHRGTVTFYSSNVGGDMRDKMERMLELALQGAEE